MIGPPSTAARLLDRFRRWSAQTGPFFAPTGATRTMSRPCPADLGLPFLMVRHRSGLREYFGPMDDLSPLLGDV